jgi:hypothetical protein
VLAGAAAHLMFLCCKTFAKSIRQRAVPQGDFASSEILPTIHCSVRDHKNDNFRAAVVSLESLQANFKSKSPRLFKAGRLK